MTTLDTVAQARSRVAKAGAQWHEADNKILLAQDLSDAIIDQLQKDLAGKNDTASLVVSGGSTPAP